MTETPDQKLRGQWEERWEGADTRERLTPLGRLMFKAKRRAVRRALRRLAPATVLDAGCGLGQILPVLAEDGRQARGVDYARSAVDACLARGLPVRHAAIEDLDETHDLVFSDGMLEHFLHFEPMALSLMRLAGRHVMLIQPNHESLSGKTLVYLAELLRGQENVFEYNYRMRDFIDVFSRHGFSLASSEPVFGDVFRLLVFERGAGQGS